MQGVGMFQLQKKYFPPKNYALIPLFIQSFQHGKIAFVGALQKKLCSKICIWLFLERFVSNFTFMDLPWALLIIIFWRKLKSLLGNLL